MEHFITECDKYRPQRQELDGQQQKLVEEKNGRRERKGKTRIRTVLGVTGDEGQK